MSAWRLRPRAVADLDEIAAFIDEFVAVFASITERPLAFRRRDDLAKGLRQSVHGRYLILFTANDDGVVIERVVHGARRLEDLI